jgi:hypothetical protein
VSTKTKATNNNSKTPLQPGKSSVQARAAGPVPAPTTGATAKKRLQAPAATPVAKRQKTDADAVPPPAQSENGPAENEVVDATREEVSAAETTPEAKMEANMGAEAEKEAEKEAETEAETEVEEVDAESVTDEPAPVLDETRPLVTTSTPDPGSAPSPTPAPASTPAPSTSVAATPTTPASDAFLDACDPITRAAALAYSAREDDAEADRSKTHSRESAHPGLLAVRKMLNLMKLALCLRQLTGPGARVIDLGVNHLQNLTLYIQCRVAHVYGYDCSRRSLETALDRHARAQAVFLHEATAKDKTKQDAKASTQEEARAEFDPTDRRYYARFLSPSTNASYRVPAVSLLQCDAAAHAWSGAGDGPEPGSVDALHLFLSLHYMARSPAALAQLGRQIHRYLRVRPGPSGIRPYVAILVPREDAVHRARTIPGHCSIARHVGPDKHHFTSYEYSQPGLIHAVREYIVPLLRLDQAIQPHGFTRRDYTFAQFLREFDPPPRPDEKPRVLGEAARKDAWGDLLQSMFPRSSSSSSLRKQDAIEHLSLYHWVVYEREANE